MVTCSGMSRNCACNVVLALFFPRQSSVKVRGCSGYKSMLPISPRENNQPSRGPPPPVYGKCAWRSYSFISAQEIPDTMRHRRFKRKFKDRGISRGTDRKGWSLRASHVRVEFSPFARYPSPPASSPNHTRWGKDNMRMYTR